MRLLSWIALAAFASLVWGCASGVDAGDAPTPTQPVQGSPGTPIPTATPKPRFGPPTVSPDILTATAQALLAPTLSPAPGDLTPGPQTPEASPSPGPTPTSTPEPVIPFSHPEDGQFISPLSYRLTYPNGWSSVSADEEVSFIHADGMIKVTLRELHVDRSNFINFAAFTQSTKPGIRQDWTAWSLSDSRAIDGGQRFGHIYNGTRNSRDHVGIVRWQLWGEILIEVAIEADSNVWATDSKLRTEAELISNTVLSVDTDAVSEVDPLRQKLKSRFGFFRSGIYVINQHGLRQELSCRDVFLQLLTDPTYIGDGVWQTHAIGDRGAQVWMIYEPTGLIVPVSTNSSHC